MPKHLKIFLGCIPPYDWENIINYFNKNYPWSIAGTRFLGLLNHEFLTLFDIIHDDLKKWPDIINTAFTLNYVLRGLDNSKRNEFLQTIDNIPGKWHKILYEPPHPSIHEIGVCYFMSEEQIRLHFAKMPFENWFKQNVYNLIHYADALDDYPFSFRLLGGELPQSSAKQLREIFFEQVNSTDNFWNENLKRTEQPSPLRRMYTPEQFLQILHKITPECWHNIIKTASDLCYLPTYMPKAGEESAYKPHQQLIFEVLTDRWAALITTTDDINAAFKFAVNEEQYQVIYQAISAKHELWEKFNCENLKIVLHSSAEESHQSFFEKVFNNLPWANIFNSGDSFNDVLEILSEDTRQWLLNRILNELDCFINVIVTAYQLGVVLKFLEGEQIQQLCDKISTVEEKWSKIFAIEHDLPHYSAVTELTRLQQKIPREKFISLREAIQKSNEAFYIRLAKRCFSELDKDSFIGQNITSFFGRDTSNTVNTNLIKQADKRTKQGKQNKAAQETVRLLCLQTPVAVANSDSASAAPSATPTPPGLKR